MHLHACTSARVTIRRTIGLAVHDDGGPALRVGGSLLHGSDGALPDAVGLGGEAGGGGAEGGGRSQEAGSNDGGELHCCCGMYWFRDKKIPDGWGTSGERHRRERQKARRSKGAESSTTRRSKSMVGGEYVTCLHILVVGDMKMVRYLYLGTTARVPR